jgi:hypothetical protein
VTPSALIPIPDALSVPWGWFQILLLLTFVIHLLFMNTMLGTGIIALAAHLKRPSAVPPFTRDVSSKLPYVIAFTINSGVAPLLFLQVLYGHFFYVSSVLMAAYWISIIGLLLIAYYSAYVYDFKFEVLASSRILFVAAMVGILLFIAFLFTNNLTLMLHPETWKSYFQRPGGTILNLSDPTLPPRYLHFVTASVAVGGLSLALLARFRRSIDPDEQQARIEAGLNWFCYATLFQVLIGLWFLMALPSNLRDRFMGGSSLHTGILLTGVALALASLALGFSRRVVGTAVALVGTVVFMVLTRELLRRGYLDPYFSLSSLPVVPQYGPLILFVCCFVGGLTVVGFILRAAIRSGKGGSQ